MRSYNLNKSIGSWDHQFDKKQTQESDFHCLNGESMKVQMMYRKSTFYLADLAELDCMAIKLPFRRSDPDLIFVYCPPTLMDMAKHSVSVDAGTHV
ncbi:hypothetical protein X801_09603 [Opisthorchis viverrini]|uniref:Serpin domain-containing protein n=1 Tax=Opisthorchis viverrini TaxID=6198 RepID=A0A1S8WJI2_OPIVI|nr:hypothetical protein X801_09603 [Opisthorchis viverrini]